MPLTSAEKAKVATGQVGDSATKLEALRNLGWIMPFDYVMAALIGCTLVTILFWFIFGAPSAINLISVVLVDVFVAQLWTISLIFRCSCFVLETRADINLMPESAARIVAGYFNRGPKA